MLFILCSGASPPLTSIKKGLWSSFPCTARPEALALAITLFQLMVAGLSSSGFGSITKITTPAVALHIAIEALAVLANS